MTLTYVEDAGCTATSESALRPASLPAPQGNGSSVSCILDGEAT